MTTCTLTCIVTVVSVLLQDLPDVQELIAEVNAEKYSLQAAAILGESPFCVHFSSLLICSRRIRTHWVRPLCSGSFGVQPCKNVFVSDTDETAEVPSQTHVKDNTVRRQNPTQFQVCPNV